MMKFREWAVGAALLLSMSALAITGAAHAATEENFQVRTTGDLVALCSPGPESPMATAAINFCHGFAQGAVSVEMQHEAASRSMRLFCLPRPAPARTETLNEFVQWARAAPDRLNGPPADGLFRFLGERFPCPKSR